MDNSNKLHILWTNSNIYTSQLMVLMYARNTKLNNLWGEITVIIWGDTAKLVAENEIIQQEIELAKQVGVKFSACLACAVALGVREKLENLDLELIYWGEPLTELIKNKENLLTI